MREPNLRVAVLVAAILIAGVVAPVSAQARVDDPSDAIVINEIMYHPDCRQSYTPCPDEPIEFIEVHNPTATVVELTGWRFIAGVDYTFPPGSFIGPNRFLVIAESRSGFNAEYGFTPFGEWNGSLSNSGEWLLLADEAGNVMESIRYSDGSSTPGAWSVGADGTGDSLSLISATESDGTSFWWDAASPTPGAANANAGQSPSAVVRDFAWTVLPQASEPTYLAAEIYGGQNVVLEYRINYPGSTVSIPMVFEGGTRWTAQIPASAYTAGDLVRFRIRNDGTRIAPRTNDTIDWVGTTVANPTGSTLPVIEWFTSDSNYNAGYSEPEDALYDGVIAFNGRVWDNVGFRIRGAIARTGDWSKRNWKFKFPDHHNFEIDGIDYGIDTMDLQGGFADEARIREFVGHTIAGEMGLVSSQVQHVHVRYNGDYFGLHTLQEHPEGGFLKDNGLENATLYKGVGLSYESGPNVTPDHSVNWDTWDIPEYLNLLAAASVIQNNDFAHGNFYSWYDADEHQRIEGMVWDLDLSQGIRYSPSDGLTVRLEDGGTWSYVWHRWKNQAPIFNQGLAQPYRELYLRRLRTLADEWFGTGRYEQVARAAFADLSGANGGLNEWALDTQRWGFWGNGYYTQQGAIDRHSSTWISQYYAHILGGGPNGDIPGPQPANPDLELFVDAAPGDNRLESVWIQNNENTAIDISGWQLDGSTTAALPPGSVLPSFGGAYVVRDDTANGFRAAAPGNYILGEYNASLPDAGGDLTLIDPGGTTRASATWGAGAPSAGLILNEWNAVTPTNYLATGDTRLGSIPGNGNDWFELVVVDDELDIRGWSLDLFNDGLYTDTISFTDDPLWSSLRAGTIITIGEENAIIDQAGAVWTEDPSYNPAGGDWWIHVVANRVGTGTWVSRTDFTVSREDWQISIHDASGTRRFGPAGEGIGTLTTTGISNTEVGELEADPAPGLSSLARYGDGNESTFGLPNNFFDGAVDRAQDFDALRPDLAPPLGDVDCSDALSLLDARAVAQYAIGARTPTAGCPLPDAGLHLVLTSADLDNSGSVSLIDARLIAQCAIGADNGYC